MRDYFKQTKTIPVGTIAIDSDSTVWALWTIPNAIKIAAIRIGVNATNTKADTNYNTLKVMNGAVQVASIANGPNSSAGTTIAAGAFGTMTLVTAAGANECAAADVLTLTCTKTGNGLAYAGVIIEIDYYDYNA